MGYFRTKKISRYSLAELHNRVVEARTKVAIAAKKYILSTGTEFSDELDDALRNWAEWREALARKMDENKSPLDKTGK